MDRWTGGPGRRKDLVFSTDASRSCGCAHFSAVFAWWHGSTRTHRALGGLLAAALVADCAAPRPPRLDPMRAVPVAQCPPMVEPRLQFQSAFWLNLHNFLNKEAKRRERIDDDGQGARGNIQADTMGLRPLNPAERRAWNSALSYYAAHVLTDRMEGADRQGRDRFRAGRSPELGANRGAAQDSGGDAGIVSNLSFRDGA